MSKSLTDADREYGRRWRESRGKRAYLIERGGLNVGLLTWLIESSTTRNAAYAELPPILYFSIVPINEAIFQTEQAANDSLAMALRECCDAVQIPGGIDPRVWVESEKAIAEGRCKTVQQIREELKGREACEIPGEGI